MSDSRSATFVSIVDYGLGNILSVERAFRAVGADVQVADAPSAIRIGAPIVIPGVGSFTEAMARLNANGFPEAIKKSAEAGSPVLGICLGMQLLFEFGEEGGGAKGLSLIQGRVVEMPRRDKDNQPLRLPLVGWRQVLPRPGSGESVGLRASFATLDEFYFVHSFQAEPADSRVVSGTYVRAGADVVAAVEAGAVWGVQFHPEKSGEAGLQLLRSFLACKAT